jgi:hypothetical protein
LMRTSRVVPSPPSAHVQALAPSTNMRGTMAVAARVGMG